MKEILVLSGCMGFILMVLWAIVLCLEKTTGRKKAGVIEKKEERKDGETGLLLSVVIAGIVAYEESFKKNFVRRRHPTHKKKEEKISLWKTKGRIEQ